MESQLSHLHLIHSDYLTRNWQSQVWHVLGHVCHQGAFGGEVSLHTLDAYKRLSLKRGLKTVVHPQVDSFSVHTAV